MKKFTILNKKSKKIQENIKDYSNRAISIESNMSVPKEQASCVKFFSKLFESKEMAHVYHLQVKGDEGSYSSHIALGEFYEKMPELIDELIEVYMGQYDVVEGYDVIDDNCNISIRHINKYNSRLDAEVEVMEDFLNIPIAECIERDSKREKPVGEKVIFSMLDQFVRGYNAK